MKNLKAAIGDGVADFANISTRAKIEWQGVDAAVSTTFSTIRRDNAARNFCLMTYAFLLLIWSKTP